MKTRYKSLKEALIHGSLAHNLKLQLNWVEAEGWKLDNRPAPSSWLNTMASWSPEASAARIEGMLQAIRYARQNKIPYFGICLGCKLPA